MHAVATAMRLQDPTILAAMDGLEAASPTPPQASRKESSVFYPIIFGLVFEALANHSNDAPSSNSSAMAASTALQTLYSLVRPEYSGNALFEAPTFNELIGLFYRMTLTESAETQLLLLQTIVSLISSRDPANLQGR